MTARELIKKIEDAAKHLPEELNTDVYVDAGFVNCILIDDVDATDNAIILQV